MLPRQLPQLHAHARTARVSVKRRADWPPAAFSSRPPPNRPPRAPTRSLQPHSPGFLRTRSFLPRPPTWGLLKPLAWAGMNPLAILTDLPRTYLPPSPGRPLVALPPAWPGGERRIRSLPRGGQLLMVWLGLLHRTSDLLASLPPLYPQFFSRSPHALPILLPRPQTLSTHLGIRAFLLPTYS